MLKSSVCATHRKGAALILLVAATWSGACSPRPSSSEGPSLRFIDAAAQAGVDRLLVSGGRDKLSIVENVGTGVALLDANGDGLLDLFLTNAGRIERGKVIPGPGLARYLSRRQVGGRDSGAEGGAEDFRG